MTNDMGGKAVKLTIGLWERIPQCHLIIFSGELRIFGYVPEVLRPSVGP